MTMKNWIERLDKQLQYNELDVLNNKGTISRDEAIKKAEKEFEIYRKNEMKNLTSDFDKSIKKIKNP